MAGVEEPGRLSDGGDDKDKSPRPKPARWPCRPSTLQARQARLSLHRSTTCSLGHPLATLAPAGAIHVDLKTTARFAAAEGNLTPDRLIADDAQTDLLGKASPSRVWPEPGAHRALGRITASGKYVKPLAKPR